MYQEIEKEEPPSQETIITIPEVKEEIPQEASVVVDEPKSESLQEKEEFEARSLEVFQKLFKSPVKCNFPLPNSALNASVFEAANAPIPAISLSHENYFDSRPILQKTTNEAVSDAIVPIPSKRNLFLDEFDANLSDSPENEANSNAMFESMPDLEQESEDDENQAIEEGTSALSIEAPAVELDSDDEPSSKINSRLDQNHPLLEFECEFDPMDTSPSESDSEELQAGNEEDLVHQPVSIVEEPHFQEPQKFYEDPVDQEEDLQSDEFGQLQDNTSCNRNLLVSDSTCDDDQFNEVILLSSFDISELLPFILFLA